MSPVMVPPVFRPARTSSNVVLPAPDVPIIAVIWPHFAKPLTLLINTKSSPPEILGTVYVTFWKLRFVGMGSCWVSCTVVVLFKLCTCEAELVRAFSETSCSSVGIVVPKSYIYIYIQTGGACEKITFSKQLPGKHDNQGGHPNTRSG